MNQQFQQITQSTPDILITGEDVEKILNYLNNTTVFVKTHEGIMRPFVDPLPINKIIMIAIQNALQDKTQ